MSGAARAELTGKGQKKTLQRWSCPIFWPYKLPVALGTTLFPFPLTLSLNMGTSVPSVPSCQVSAHLLRLGSRITFCMKLFLPLLMSTLHTPWGRNVHPLLCVPIVFSTDFLLSPFSTVLLNFLEAEAIIVLILCSKP